MTAQRRSPQVAQATIAQNVLLRSPANHKQHALMPRTDPNDAYFLSESRLPMLVRSTTYRSNGSFRTPKEKRSQHGSSFDQITSSFRYYIRASSDTPKLNAFWRVAPSVRFSFFAIFPARVFFRASVFKVRTSSVVQERRFPFFMIRLLRIIGITAR